MPEKRSSVPDLMVERLAIGDLDPRSATEVRTKLEAAGATGRLAELAESNRAILDAHPAAEVLAAARRRLGHAPPASRPARRRGGMAAGWILGATAVAALLLAIGRPASRPGGDGHPFAGGPEEIIRTKGLAPHLVVYKKTPEGAARLDRGSRARPGERLQVAYVAAGRRYGVVVSQDARGAVTFHLPTKGAEAVTLKDGGEIPTASSFQLDDSPGYERFVFVTSDQPFSTAAVLEMLSKPQTKLPPAMSVNDLVVLKEVR